MSPRPRRLGLALLASLVVHVILYLGLAHRSGPLRAEAGHGEVSVDLIESVQHGSTEPVVAPAPPTAVPVKKLPRPNASGGPAKDSISETRSRAVSPTAVAGSGAAADLFRAEIARLIDREKVYPRPALRRELEGRVVVAITLDAAGALTRAEVEEPCSFALLNEAALAAVRGVEKFPPLPPGVGPTLHLHVPLVFKIKR